MNVHGNAKLSVPTRLLLVRRVLDQGWSVAVAAAGDWARSHSVAVLHVRFGARGAIVEVLPRNVESLGAVPRGRALA